MNIQMSDRIHQLYLALCSSNLAFIRKDHLLHSEGKVAERQMILCFARAVLIQNSKVYSR